MPEMVVFFSSHGLLLLLFGIDGQMEETTFDVVFFSLVGRDHSLSYSGRGDVLVAR